MQAFRLTTILCQPGKIQAHCLPLKFLLLLLFFPKRKFSYRITAVSILKLEQNTDSGEGNTAKFGEHGFFPTIQKQVNCMLVKHEICVITNIFFVISLFVPWICRQPKSL